MTRMLTIAMVAVVTAAALAGCAQNEDGDGNGGDGNTGPGGNQPPQAIVTFSPLTPIAGQPVSFEAVQAGSNTVSWQFGDGENATGNRVQHAYASPGRYIVFVNVTNAGGQSATNEGALTYLSVARPEVNSTAALAPVADFTLDRQVLRVGENVTVNASASYAVAQNPKFNQTLGLTPGNLPVVRDAGNVTSYTWDWGDGSAPTTSQKGMPEANHTYGRAGVYPIRLTVTDAKGANGTFLSTVVVSETPPAVGGYKHKDLFVTATISGPQSFDPGFDYETAGGHVIQQVYETLFGTERGNSDRIVPVLAAEVPSRENGGISADGLTYTIKLRQGVKFHDNTDFDAEAVKFSLDRLVLMKDPASGASVVAPVLKGATEYRASNGTVADRAAYLAQNAVQVVDKHTVRITLPKPDPAVFQRLAFYGSSIVSPTAFKAAHSERAALWGVPTTTDGLPPPTTPGGAPVTRDPWADTNMVGTGPFKLRKWLPGDRVILDRNDAYWGEKAQLKTVIIQYVDDLNTRILMFRSGDADEIYVPASEIARVRAAVGNIANFIPADTLIVDTLFMNWNVEDPALCPKAGGQAKCDLFSNPRAREGVIYAFNYQSFFDNVWNGLARPLAGVIPRGMPGYDDSLKAYAQDKERAKAAWAEVCPNGCEFEVYYNTGNTVREKGAQLLKDSVEGLGANVKVTVRGLPFNQLLDKSQKGQIPLQFAGWSPDYIATDNYIVPFLSKDGYFGSSFNIHDPEIQARIDAAVAETDPAKQAAAWKEINRMAVEKHVSAYLDQRSQVHVERNYVRGYYYDPLASGSPNIGDYAAISKA